MQTPPVDIWTPIIACCAFLTLVCGGAVFVLRLWFRAELAEFRLSLTKDFDERYTRCPCLSLEAAAHFQPPVH